jgi:hypothetical protein
MTHTVWPTVATTSPCRGVGIGGDEIHSPSAMSDFSTVPRSRRRCPPVPPRSLKREGQQGSNGGSGALGLDAAIDDPDSPLQVTVDGYGRAGDALGALGLPTVVEQVGGPTTDPLSAGGRDARPAWCARDATMS